MTNRVYGEGWFQQTDESTDLIGCRCKSCNTYWFPIRHVCPNCFGENLIKESLSNEGEVYSLTKLHVTSRLFEAPLTIAYVDFPEGVRVCGQIEGDAEIGAKVQPTFGKIRTDSDGTPVFSYKFKALS